MPSTHTPVELDLTSQAFLEDPYAVYARLREAGPLHWSERYRSFFLSRYDDVAAFFLEGRLTADRTAASKFRGERRSQGVRSLASEPPEHTLVRALLTRSMSPAVAAMAGRIEELVADLLARVDAAVAAFFERTELGGKLSGEIDLIERFAYPLPITVIAEMFAVPEADREQFQSWSHDIARGMDHFYAKDSGTRRFEDLARYFDRLVAERRRAPGDDLLSCLAAAEHDGERLSDGELVALATSLLFAGHETTVNLIGNGVLALLRHPAELERLREEGERLAPAAIEELLRFESPAQLIARAALEGFDLLGQRIAPGDSVVGLLGSANRDPQRFTSPDQLQLDRRPNPHLAFGRGRHFCPGATLSRLEARAAIPGLLRRFPRLRLAERPPVWRRTAVLRGLESLPVLLD